MGLAGEDRKWKEGEQDVGSLTLTLLQLLIKTKAWKWGHVFFFFLDFQLP